MKLRKRGGRVLFRAYASVPISSSQLSIFTFSQFHLSLLTGRTQKDKLCLCLLSQNKRQKRGENCMSQQNVALAQSVYDAFARGDVPTVVGAMDPNIEWIEPEAPGFPFGGVRRGPQEVVDNVFALLQTYYQEIAFLPQEFVDDGDRVL